MKFSIILLLLVLILFLLIVVVFYWLPKWMLIPFSKVFPNVKTRLSQDAVHKKQIALTFDDVPYSDNTFSDLLNLLDEYQIKATFFVISGQITETSRPLLIKAIKKGHLLANHGNTDSMHMNKRHHEFINEFQTCHNTLMELYSEAKIEIPVLYYRPGSGFFSYRMLNYIEKRGYKLALGSVYPHDPIVRSPTVNFPYLKHHVKSGDIVIIHDREWTIPMLKEFLPWINDQKFECVILT